MKLFSSVLTRFFTGCNYDIVKLWHTKNIGEIESNFYRKKILMSGTVKKRGSDTLEIVYLKYYAEEMIDSIKVLQIYSCGIKKFPSYYQYVKYIQERTENDIVNRIIKKISPECESLKINRENYDLECKQIEKQFFNPFINYIPPQVVKRNNISSFQSDALQKNELAFIGKAIMASYSDFKELLCYKVLEKLLGSNDVNGVYFSFRKQGWIYTGLSGFVIESNFFYSGAILQYNEEHANQIMNAIESFEFSIKEFENAKKMVCDDYYYAVFQFGEEFALLPYKLQVENAINLEEHLSKVTISEVRIKLHQLCSQGMRIRMRVV